jgi:hypothetical protein
MSSVSELVSEMQEFQDPADYLTGARVFSHPDDCEVRPQKITISLSL